MGENTSEVCGVFRQRETLWRMEDQIEKDNDEELSEVQRKWEEDHDDDGI